MLQLKGITKDYLAAENTVHALKGIDLRFRRNEFVSILGASGCGKTTLLNIIGGLDHYTSGDLVICGVSTKDYKDHDWDVYRNHRIGFVFQSYNLIPHQTVLGNVELALTIAGISKVERRQRAEEALKKVGLENEMHKRPNQLSGGQMQRVAIARALVNNPEILLADEPTGALDTETSVQIMDLIREIAGERLVIMVTHNPELAEEYSSRIVRLQDGLVIADSNPYEGESTENGVESETIAETEGEERTADLDEKTLKAQLRAAKKAERAAKRAEKRQREKSSMSFKTSLGLSARNLASKKGRTIITSVAGSIGIISVCLVLALSNGFNSYILKTQEDMLSYYPIEISETTLNMEEIMTGMSSRDDMPDLSELDNKVYVNSFLTNIAKGMTVKNDLSDEYITYLESMDKSLYSAIQYNYGVDLSNNIYTSVQTGIEEEGTVTTRYMSLSELKAFYRDQISKQDGKYASLAYLVDYLGNVYGKMPGTSDFNDPEYGEYVRSQYKVFGEFPKASNEAVLVIGDNNDVTDLTLAQLGFIEEERFLHLFDTSETSEEKETYTIDFDTVFNKLFVLYNNDAVYTPAAETAEYLFEYQGERADLAEDNGVAIKITGILRLKDGLTYGCLSNGINFTEKLVTEFIASNKTTAIGQKVEEGAYTPFYAGYAMYDKPLTKELAESFIAFEQQVPVPGGNGATVPMSGYVADKVALARSICASDTISNILLYTESFDTKEGLIAHLDKWNETHKEVVDPTTGEIVSKEVRYTDTVGLMMGMVQTILNAITYVLVAFTSISLVVSSVMIGIITYVSVVERTKEIGVLRSLGARKKDIKNLFNAETFIIGLASGVFGVAVTYIISFGVNALLGKLTGISTLASLPFGSAMVMIVISILLTLISGLIPAKAAAKKDPVVALRTE